MSTWTFTFGECVENHAGMQKIGFTGEANSGFSFDDLVKAGWYFKNKNFDVEFFRLTDALPENVKSLLPQNEINTAYLLIIRKGMKCIFNENEYNNFITETEHTKNIVDKKALMRGKVVNKHARWNLCYSDLDQVADFENGKGTIVNFDKVTCLNKIRHDLPDIIGEKGRGLYAELNYYYDINKCTIGYHGDTERRRVVGIRMGSSFPLHYQWYHETNAIGPKFTFNLNSGDIYFMGEKAVGTDWKKRKIPTLRHAAGLNL